MNNLLSSIGLCRRAGFTVCGFDPVLKEALAENPKIAGIFVAEDISDKTLKELHFKARDAEILKIPASMAEIETVFGKRIAVIGITDRGFYKTLRDKVLSSNKNLGET